MEIAVINLTPAMMRSLVVEAAELGARKVLESCAPMKSDLHTKHYLSKVYGRKVIEHIIKDLHPSEYNVGSRTLYSEKEIIDLIKK